MKNFFTRESVTSGHPDKVCDNISDAVLDAYLKGDPNSRVACECSATTDFLLVMGEITSNATVDVEKVARDTIRKIGYTDKNVGFSYDDVKVLVKLNKQSPDIALGVDNSFEKKASSAAAAAKMISAMYLSPSIIPRPMKNSMGRFLRLLMPSLIRSAKIKQTTS